MSSDAAIWLMKWLNFLMLAGLITYFGRRPLLELLSSLVKDTEKIMSNADEELATAQSELSEAESLISDLDKELAVLDSDARERAELIAKDIEDHAVREVELLQKHKETEKKLLREGTLARVHNVFVETCFSEAKQIVKTNIKIEDHKAFNKQGIDMILEDMK